MGKLKISASLILLLATSAMGLTACGGGYETFGNEALSSSGTGTGTGGSSNCDAKLMTAYKSYHAVLKQQCAACHISGGSGNGAFADSNLSTAYNVFKLKTEAKVYAYAIDPSHKAPFSGTDNIALLDAPKQTWNAAMTVYNDCMSAGSNPGTGGGGGGGNSGVSIFTQSKTITLVAGAAGTTVTWTFATDMITANPDLAGGKVTALVEGAMGSTSPYIVVSNIQVTGGALSLYAKNIGVQLNGTLVAAPTGATFATAERYIPKMAARNVAKSGGAMIVPVTSLKDLQIALGFEKLEKSKLDGFDIDFDPPTHTQLVSTNATAVKRVFNARCTSCHNANNKQAGLDLTNYNSIYGADIKPFEPEKSAVYLSIESGSMPPAGALPPAERDSVRFWIMDGAPR